MIGFQTLRVNEVATVFNGKTPSKAQQRDSGHPVLKIRDVDELGRFRGTFSGHVDSELAQKHTKQQIAGGETLILNAAHSSTHVASKTYYADGEVAGSLATGEWLMIRWAQEAADPRYGNHWINAPQTRFRLRQLVNGIHLYPKDVARLQIPLPPLAEQKRIAAILDAADALRAKRRESLALLDTLLQSTFLDMFGDPATNPMGWDTKELADTVFVQGGFAFRSKDYCEQGVRLVKISNVHGGNLRWHEIDLVPDLYLQRYKDFALESGDLVIALTRPIIKSLDSVKIATVGPMDAPSLLNQRVARFVFSRNRTIEKSYLLAFCRTQFFKNAVQRFCSESLQPNMSTKQLGSVLIAQPPLDLQHRFTAIVESIEQRKSSQRAHLDELDALFASLQHRAFSGKL